MFWIPLCIGLLSECIIWLLPITIDLILSVSSWLDVVDWSLICTSLFMSLQGEPSRCGAVANIKCHVHWWCFECHSALGFWVSVLFDYYPSLLILAWVSAVAMRWEVFANTGERTQGCMQQRLLGEVCHCGVSVGSATLSDVGRAPRPIQLMVKEALQIQKTSSNNSPI